MQLTVDDSCEDANMQYVELVIHLTWQIDLALANAIPTSTTKHRLSYLIN